MAFVNAGALKLFPSLKNRLQTVSVNYCRTSRSSLMTIAEASTPRTDSQLITDVLTHWFGSTEISKYDSLESQFPLWYSSTNETDDDIRNRFGHDIERALNGELDHFILSDEETFKPDIALMVLLDQYPRNIYRGDAKAFAGDEKSRLVVNQLISDDRWKNVRSKVPVVQCLSFMLPLMHQESIQDLDACVEKTTDLVEDCKARGPEADKCLKIVEESLEYAHLHRDIIVKFGRYPHRNTVLKRDSNEEEQNFLVDGPRFGQ